MSLEKKRITSLTFVVLVLVIYLVPFLDLLGPFKAIPAGLIILQFFAMKETSPTVEMGLTRPTNWLKTFMVALVLAVMIFVVRAYFIEDWIYHFFPYPKNIEVVTPDTSEPTNVLGWIIMMFFFAALPEELIWRGFLIPQLAKIFGEMRISWILSILITSVFFGLAHHYQGPAGIFSTGIGGLFYGAIYYFDKRSLWKVILVHWMINSISIIVETMGW